MWLNLGVLLMEELDRPPFLAGRDQLKAPLLACVGLQPIQSLRCQEEVAPESWPPFILHNSPLS